MKRGATLVLAVFFMLGAAYLARDRAVPEPAAPPAAAGGAPSSALGWRAGDVGSSPAAADPDDGPTGCLTRMFQAAEAGELEAYLDCFTGELRKQLDGLANDRAKRSTLADFVRAGASGLKGVATHDLRRQGPDAAQLVLERIYANRNERQTIHLRRAGGRWRISGLGSPRRFIPEIPYGTPVYRAQSARGSARGNEPAASTEDAK